MHVLLKHKQDLFLQHNMVYRWVKLKNHDSVINQFVLPNTFHRRTMLALHDDYGHLGMKKNLELLQERFFWPKMVEDVRNHIRTFEQCTKFKQPPGRERMKPIQCTYPLELVHIDFLMIGKEGTNKAINIMVITNHFTRYAQAYITSKQTTPVVAKSLWDRFLVHYAWPTKILLDQGKSFENSISMLGTLPIHAKKNWPEWVNTLTHAYNATMCHVTGFSPFFLMYGKIPILPIDVEFGRALPDLSHASRQNYVEKLKAQLKWACKVAKDTNDHESARHKKYYDLKYKCMKVVPGDLVLDQIIKLLSDGSRLPMKYNHSIKMHLCTKSNQ